MTCPSTEELSAVFDQNLPSKHLQQTRDHVARCPRCAQEMASLHQLLKDLAPSSPPSVDLIERAVGLAGRPPAHRSQDRRVGLDALPARTQPGKGRD